MSGKETDKGKMGQFLKWDNRRLIWVDKSTNKPTHIISDFQPINIKHQVYKVTGSEVVNNIVSDDAFEKQGIASIEVDPNAPTCPVKVNRTDGSVLEKTAVEIFNETVEITGYLYKVENMDQVPDWFISDEKLYTQVTIACLAVKMGIPIRAVSDARDLVKDKEIKEWFREKLHKMSTNARRHHMEKHIRMVKSARKYGEDNGTKK